MTDDDNFVLLIAPSRGLGGGIERYVATVEAMFEQHQIAHQRLNLLDGTNRRGLPTKIRLVRHVRQLVRTSPGPVRLVLAHGNLLPIVPMVADLSQFSGATVIMHGAELWANGRVRGHRTLRRSDVRAVAASNFSAGALATVCRANVLPPGVAPDWYETLVRAGCRPRRPSAERGLVTAFRLHEWRAKGLETILEAIRLVGDEWVRLTICGTGSVPRELAALIEPYSWCRLTPNLADHELADQLAAADLCIMATRTRHGSRACGEGFGLVLLEAQLAGTAVVAPAFGGSADAFQPGITGVAPLDETPVALARVLINLLADNQLSARMGEAAAAWSRTAFEPKAHSRRVVQTLLGTNDADFRTR